MWAQVSLAGASVTPPRKLPARAELNDARRNDAGRNDAGRNDAEPDDAGPPPDGHSATKVDGSGLPKRWAVILMACSCRNGSISIRPEVVTGPA